MRDLMQLSGKFDGMQVSMTRQSGCRQQQLPITACCSGLKEDTRPFRGAITVLQIE